MIDLVNNFLIVLTDPLLLGHFTFNALFGSLAFALAIRYSHYKTKASYVLKYIYAFISINFIVRCFLLITYHSHAVGNVTTNLIAFSTVGLIAVGALVNVCSFHVGNKVAIRYKKKR